MTQVCHIIGPDIPRQREPLFRALWSIDTRRHGLLRWRGGFPDCDLRPARSIGGAGPLAALGVVGRHPARTMVEQADLLHCWSPAALAWYLDESGWTKPRPILAEVDGTVAPAELCRRAQVCPNVRFVARGPHLAEAVRARGVPDTRIVELAEPVVACPAPDPRGVRRIVLLGSGDDKATLFDCFWGLLLAHKVYLDIRVVPIGPDEPVARIARLARAAGSPEVLLPRPADPWSAIAGADLVVHAGRGFCQAGDCLSILAAGIPLVAIDGPTTRALVAAEDCWLSPAARPNEIARQVVFAFEDPDEMRVRADRARERVAGQTIEEAAADLVRLYDAATPGATERFTPRVVVER